MKNIKRFLQISVLTLLSICIFNTQDVLGMENPYDFANAQLDEIPAWVLEESLRLAPQTQQNNNNINTKIENLYAQLMQIVFGDATLNNKQIQFNKIKAEFDNLIQTAFNNNNFNYIEIQTQVNEWEQNLLSQGNNPQVVEEKNKEIEEIEEKDKEIACAFCRQEMTDIAKKVNQDYYCKNCFNSPGFGLDGGELVCFEEKTLNDQGEFTCLICADNLDCLINENISMVIFPCLHMTCLTCSKKLTNKCPMCRRTFEDNQVQKIKIIRTPKTTKKEKTEEENKLNELYKKLEQLQKPYQKKINELVENIPLNPFQQQRNEYQNQLINTTNEMNNNTEIKQTKNKIKELKKTIDEKTELQEKQEQEKQRHDEQQTTNVGYNAPVNNVHDIAKQEALLAQQRAAREAEEARLASEREAQEELARQTQALRRQQEQERQRQEALRRQQEQERQRREQERQRQLAEQRRREEETRRHAAEQQIRRGKEARRLAAEQQRRQQQAQHIQFSTSDEQNIRTHLDFLLILINNGTQVHRHLNLIFQILKNYDNALFERIKQYIANNQPLNKDNIQEIERMIFNR